MSETKFTPERWRVWRDQDPKEPLYIEGMESDFICQLCMENTQAVANARMIAAAPDLFQLLTESIDIMERQVDYSGELASILTRAKALLAKIGGAQ